MDDPARWLTPAPMPETDHHLLHTEALEDRPPSRTTFVVPDTSAIAFAPDGRLAFRRVRELFVSDREGKRIVRVAEDLPFGHEIRWVR